MFNVTIGAMPDLDELRGMGQKIREQVVEQILRERQHLLRQIHPDWFEEEKAAGAEPGQTTDAAGAASPSNREDIGRRLGEVGAQLQSVAEQLRRPNLTDEQRAELAEQLARLSQEQALLAREHATLRQKQDAHRTEKLHED